VLDVKAGTVGSGAGEPDVQPTPNAHTTSAHPTSAGADG
jgi:hypothetical protein